MKKLVVLILLCVSQAVFQQNNKQNIRGVVTDKLTRSPLLGAYVQLVNLEKIGGITDEKGNFVLPNILPDRYEIKISSVGYKTVMVPNVVVISGKETILDITMVEVLLHYDKVDVTANHKDKTISDQATISTRTFSKEEVNRYAGGRSDPARLAAIL